MNLNDDCMRALRYDLDKITNEINKFCRDRKHKYNIAKRKWHLSHSEFITIYTLIGLREQVEEQYRQDRIELNFNLMHIFHGVYK